MRITDTKTTRGNGAEKPSSQSANSIAQRSRLRRTLLFAGVFALLAIIYVPAPGQPHTGTHAHYRFIFSQHETGIAFFQLLLNVGFAAIVGALAANMPKRVFVGFEPMIGAINQLIDRMSALTSSDSDATSVMELPA